MATPGLVAAVSAGLLKPVVVRAYDWPDAAFRAQSAEAAVKALFPGKPLLRSNLVRIKTPETAEIGSQVPVITSADLSDVRSITLVCTKNPFPLAVSVRLVAGMESEMQTRVKLSEPQEIWSVFEAENSLFLGTRFVRVSVGGCGG